MLSRVADSLYWMTRYLERAEYMARLLGVHWNLMLEQPSEASEGRWNRVRRSLGMEALPEGAQTTQDLLQDLCFDHAHRSSIVAAVTAARDNARQVREQISSEMWEQLNRLFHSVRQAGQDEWWQGEPVEFLNSVKEGCHLFQGLTDSTMSHGEGWQFIQLGRFFERAVDTAALVDVHFSDFEGGQNMRPDAGPDAADYLEWIGLLRCATAFEAYCKVYTAHIEPNQVAEFLILNEQFPHSLRFAVSRMEDAMTAVSEVSPSRRGSQVMRVAGRLAASLSYSQIDEIMSAGLPVWIEDIRKQCRQIHTGVHQAFIAYPIETALEA